MLKPDIVDTARILGIELKRAGNSYRALCFSHLEKTPSLFFNPGKQIAHCFGCGYHADSIKLVSDYKGLSFKDALKYLGISTGRPTPEAIKKIQQEKHRRELVKAFKAWCNDYHNDLCYLYRTLQGAKDKAKTVEQVEALAPYYHKESS